MSAVTAEGLIPGERNFRDVGGLSAGDGVTRRGVLYRSGNLASLDPAGSRALGRLGLRRIIDLRADDEVRWAPSRIDGLDVPVTRVPLFQGSVDSFFARDVSLAQLYREMIDGSATGIGHVVRRIVADQPVLVHCTVGKDRTGVTVALTLAAAGVDEDAILADYARTEALLPRGRTASVLAQLRALHPGSVHVEDLTARSPASAMADLFTHVRREYGSVTDYLMAAGVPEDELRALPAVLVAQR